MSQKRLGGFYLFLDRECSPWSETEGRKAGKDGDRHGWVMVTIGGMQDFLLEVLGGHRRV